MKGLRVSEDLKPLSEIKARAGDVVRQVEETGRPVVVTRHGRGVAVLLSVASYERFQRLEQRAELVDALREAERDVAAGRLVTHADARARLAARIRELDGG